MNVREKEALVRDESESSPSDSPNPFKVSKSSVVYNASRSNRAIAYREPRFVSAMDARRMLSERSQSLYEFITPLEEEIRKLLKARRIAKKSARSGVRSAAQLVLSIIGKIAHRETALFSLEPNIPLLLSALYAGSVEASIVAGLVRRAQAALAELEAYLNTGSGSFGYGQSAALSDPNLGEGYDVGRELEELGMLLKWYVRRKMSLAALEVTALRAEEMSEVEVLGGEREEDALFGFEVLHDHEVFGAKGCYVTCGARLVGHDGQALWLRVGVRWNGVPVAVRPEWNSWSDPGGELAASAEVSEAPAFCSLVPIRPNAQRLVIDEVRAFVPYGALDLPAGRCDVEVVSSIVDSEGREVLATSRREGICIPRRELVHTNVPAPHSVGMWPHDVVSGDKISELRVSSGYKVLGGWERHTISISFDLSLFMHAGESVLLECRFLDEKGDLVELSSLGIPYVAADIDSASESVTSYRYRRTLHPKGAWAHFRGLCIDIPVEFLLIDTSSKFLTCEVVVVSSDDRVLCGDMGVVDMVRATPANHPGVDKTGSSDPHSESIASGVEIESLDIDANWAFGGEETIRVQATFCPKDASRRLAELASGRVGELFSPYRVEIALEREDGHVLLQAFSDPLGISFKPVTRGVCVEGHTGLSEHSVVTNFIKDEVLAWSLAWSGDRQPGKVRLFARVAVRDLSGELLASEGKEFYVKPTAGHQKKVMAFGAAHPSIIDVVAHTFVQAPKVSCRALVNLPHGRFLGEGFQLEASLVDSTGAKTQSVQRKVMAHRLSGWTKQQMGLSQMAVEWEHDLTPTTQPPCHVHVRVLSNQGEVLQTLQQPVKSSGVLSEPTDSSAVSASTGLQSSERMVPEDAIVDDESAPKGQQKGLLSWLWR